MDVFERKELEQLTSRIKDQPKLIQIIAGPRQVGKTTLARQAMQKVGSDHSHFVAIDQPETYSMAETYATTESDTIEIGYSPRDEEWLIGQWNQARQKARRSSQGFILFLDEIQKIPRWSEVVKGLWDADQAEGLDLRVVLLGSSPLLLQKGMNESLAGRYELIRLSHWSFKEMHDAFAFDLTDYLYFGGYPGSARFIGDTSRWKNYIVRSLIEPNIEKDILMMTRIDKPALLRNLFYLSCEYSGQILAFDKMLGQLQDAGNTTTLARYLTILGQADLVVGLQQYAGQRVRRRASKPKLNVLNTALINAVSDYSKEEAVADRSYWGRLVESAVGAHLYNTGHPDCNLYYWRKSPFEVDFILEKGNLLSAIEVKSGATKGYTKGLDQFEHEFGACKKICVGDAGIPLVEFLSYPAEHWL